MGGRIGRTLFAAVTTLALATSSVSGAGALGAADACVGGALAEPPPGTPYAKSPAIVIRVAWSEADATGLQYVVTDSRNPIIDPFGGHDAAVEAGCTGEAILCGPVAPLILSDAPGSATNLAPLWAGRYTIVAAPGGACAYFSGEGGRAEYAKVSKQVTVTAVLEYYPAGAEAPSFSRTLAPATVPTLQEPPMELGPYRRILGTFEWDPNAGIGNVVAVGAPGTNGLEGTAGRPTLALTADERLATSIILLVAILRDPEGALEALLAGEWQGSLIDPLSEDGSSAGQGVAELADRPSGAPPRMSKKAAKQHRQWVWLPAEVSVRGNDSTRRLKPGIWYQTKVGKDGVRAFYDKKGKLVGRTREEVPVKVWGMEAEALDENPGARLLTLLVDATTGSVKMRPANPPPWETPPGSSWVYVTLPTQTYVRERQGNTPSSDDWSKHHVLVPGRWYIERQADGHIYSSEGEFLGENVDEAFVKALPTAPVPVLEPGRE